jgi:hypothetical protein
MVLWMKKAPLYNSTTNLVNASEVTLKGAVNHSVAFVLDCYSALSNS